jgi:hypothetical protein
MTTATTSTNEMEGNCARTARCVLSRALHPCVASRRSPDRHVAAVSQPPSQPTAARPRAAMFSYLWCDFCSVWKSDAYMCQTDRWDVSYAPDGHLCLQFVDLMARSYAPPLEFDQSGRPTVPFRIRSTRQGTSWRYFVVGEECKLHSELIHGRPTSYYVWILTPCYLYCCLCPIFSS